jgi:polyhydroxyalkanoate synthesis regulator phasin
MSFFDKVKRGAQQAAGTVRDEVQDLQTRNEIVRTYENLGRKVFELVDKGQLSHDDVKPYVDHIRELRDKLEAAEQAGWTNDKEETEQEQLPKA